MNVQWSVLIAVKVEPYKCAEDVKPSSTFQDEYSQEQEQEQKQGQEQ